ncbi:acetate--CoA ligase, partial [Mycobacteroides abscessus]
MNKITGVVVAICAALMFSPSANADPPPPGCARVPLLGLNPQILEMCDGPINPDGSWERARRYW